MCCVGNARAVVEVAAPIIAAVPGSGGRAGVAAFEAGFGGIGRAATASSPACLHIPSDWKRSVRCHF